MVEDGTVVNSKNMVVLAHPLQLTFRVLSKAFVRFFLLLVFSFFFFLFFFCIPAYAVSRAIFPGCGQISGMEK